MFDIDQDEEILAVIQTAYECMYNIDMSSNQLNIELRRALEKVKEKYGMEIFTYNGE